MTSTNAQLPDGPAGISMPGSPAMEQTSCSPAELDRTPHGVEPDDIPDDIIDKPDGAIEPPGGTPTTDSDIETPDGITGPPNTLGMPDVESGNSEMRETTSDLREQDDTTVSPPGRDPNSTGSGTEPNARAQIVFNNTILTVNSAYAITRSPIITVITAVIAVVVSFAITRTH